MSVFPLPLINEEQILAALEATLPTIQNPFVRLQFEGVLSQQKLMRAESSFQDREVQLCAERDALRTTVNELFQKNFELKRQFQKERESLQAQAQTAINERLAMGRLLLQMESELKANEGELEKAKSDLAEAKTVNDQLQQKLDELKTDLEAALSYHEQSSKAGKVSLTRAKKKLEGWEDYSEGLKHDYQTYKKIKSEQDEKIAFLEAKVQRLETDRRAEELIRNEEKKQSRKRKPEEIEQASLRPAKRKREMQQPPVSSTHSD